MVLYYFNMKRVAATHTHVYQAPTIELQCNWLIPDLALQILQRLYYRDITSFSCSCKQTYHLINQEDFWPKLVDSIFSSNESPKKLSPRKKLKIYSNLIENRYCEKSIEVKDCQYVRRRIVWSNCLAILCAPPDGDLSGAFLHSKLEMIDLKELKMMEDPVGIYYPACEIIVCQDQVVIGHPDFYDYGRIEVKSDPRKRADICYPSKQRWTRFACDPEREIVAMADDRGTIFVWKIKDEPSHSKVFSISINRIDDLSICQDVVIARGEKTVCCLNFMSKEPIREIVLPDVSHAAVYQGQLVTSHNVISEKVVSPVVKVWDAKTLELTTTINLAQLSWEVNPRHDMDCWGRCDWTKPCMEGVFISQVSVGDGSGGFIVVWNLKTKKGSVLEDVDPADIKRNFLIHEGQFITTDYDHPNIIKFFDFSGVKETAK